MPKPKRQWRLGGARTMSNLFMDQMVHIEQSNTLNGVDVPSTDDMMALNVIIMLDSINAILNKNVWDKYIKHVKARRLYANREGIEIMLKSIPEFVTLLNMNEVNALNAFINRKSLTEVQCDMINKINACALTCYIRRYGIDAAKEFFILPQFSDEEVDLIAYYKLKSLINNNNNKILDTKRDLKELEKYTNQKYLDSQILLVKDIMSDLNSELNKYTSELRDNKDKLHTYSKWSTNHIQKLRRDYKEDPGLDKIISDAKQEISKIKDEKKEIINKIENKIDNLKIRLSNEDYYLSKLNSFKKEGVLDRKIKSINSKLNRLEHYDPTGEVDETREYYKQVFEYLRYVFQID